MNSGTEKETVGTVAVCAECGQGEHYYVHSPDNPAHHKFQVKKRKKELSHLPDNPEEFVHGATA